MAKSTESHLRIISGKFRGRKISFHDSEGLRPTHDRIRETLFNWLQSDILDAKCLDLFAGSGALGFEALSRGAKQVVFVDTAKSVIHSLKDNIKMLDVENADVFLYDFLSNKPAPFDTLFDVVFLDPPFHKGLWTVAIAWLNQNKLLKPGSLIYLEVEGGGFDAHKVTDSYDIIRHKQTKSLEYLLLEKR